MMGRNMATRSVLGVTGIRSDYDIMSSVFHAIQRHDELDLHYGNWGPSLAVLWSHC